jgi:sugar lactone lactonase YvrE
VRVAPNGEIDRVIEMPVLNPTRCTFGGPDLGTLYITSAGLDAPPSDRLGGGVFTIRTDVPGQPENRVTAFGGRRN